MFLDFANSRGLDGREPTKNEHLSKDQAVLETCLAQSGDLNCTLTF
jgi:hypothetical protein